MSLSPLQELDRENYRRAALGWKAERVGWVAMALIMVLALMGVFATGPLSWSEAHQPETEVALRYERFVRRGGTTSLNLSVPTAHAEEGTISVWVSRDYLEEILIEQITPTPDSAAADDDGIVFEFSVEADADIAGEIEIDFVLTPDAIGSRRGEIGLAGRRPVTFRQLMYP